MFVEAGAEFRWPFEGAGVVPDPWIVWIFSPLSEPMLEGTDPRGVPDDVAVRLSDSEIAGEARLAARTLLPALFPCCSTMILASLP
jgi:hypothetical protein